MCRLRFPWARRSSWPGASRAMRPLSSSVAFCGGQKKPGSLRVPSGNQNVAIGGWSMDKRFGGARDTSHNTPRGRWEEHRARFEAELGLVLPSAAAIELIHTYSLVHDDLPAMDDDEYRRGRPTTHRKYGEAMAILTGDAFFGEALTLITVHQEGSCEQVLEVVRELARSTGVNGMVGGQVIDMDQTGVGEEADPETLHMIHTYKTGALIKSSARIGATLAGTTEDEQASITEYATELGLCFQIVDDLLNATSTREALGKSAGSDAEQGKATFVGVYGLSGAEEEANKAAEKALSA